MPDISWNADTLGWLLRGRTSAGQLRRLAACMNSVTRRWLIAAAVLAIVSAVALTLLTSGEVVPSAVRDPFFNFVQPGVTVWWFVLGGPFRSAPTSPAGIAFAAATNAALWLLVWWLL